MNQTIAVIYERRSLLEGWLYEHPSLEIKQNLNTAIGLDGTEYRFFSTQHPHFMRGYTFNGCVVLGSITKEAHDMYSSRMVKYEIFNS